MCSVRRIVPELISFDDLRDKFLSRVEVPRDPLRKLSRNFKGSRLSAQLLFHVGWMDGLDPKDNNEDFEDTIWNNYDALERNF